jgi:6,7-dimethyl-8-ribityllumazine synthase
MSEVPDKSSPDESQIMLYDAAFCIIAAEFNSHIVDALVAGAHSALLRHGVAESAIELVNVPGAFEVPLAAQRVARSGQYDGIVALAAIVRGGTPHFDYVSSQSIGGLGRVALECDIPVGNGVLTVDTMQQALDRAGGSEGNKGEESALAAIEMVHLLRRLDV